MSIGFTENEFMMSRQFSRNLDVVTDQANAIIASRNRELSVARQTIARLEAALRAERAKTADLLEQILGTAQ